jgi:hypothetical protein
MVQVKFRGCGEFQVLGNLKTSGNLEFNSQFTDGHNARYYKVTLTDQCVPHVKWKEITTRDDIARGHCKVESLLNSGGIK